MADKVLLFDVGGVLVNYDNRGIFAEIRCNCEKEISNDDIGKLIRDLNVNAKSHQVNSLYLCLVEGYGYKKSFSDFVKTWNSGISERSWVPEFINRLRQKNRLFIISDTNNEHWSYVENILNLAPFDKLFLSHELGMTKATDAIFRHVLNDIDYSAEDCLFIDDTLANIEVASAIGLNTHLYQSADGMIGRIESFTGQTLSYA